MSTANQLNRFLEPIMDALTPETARILANLQASAERQAQVDELATKANDGTITPEEEAEYKSIVDAADLIAILQLNARRYLTDHTP